MPGKCRGCAITEIYPCRIYYCKEGGYDSQQVLAVQGFDLWKVIVPAITRRWGCSGYKWLVHKRQGLSIVLVIICNGLLLCWQQSINWAMSWENLLMLYANNKDADQPVHPRSLISTFVVCCLDSIIPLVSISNILSLYLASEAEQPGLSLTWSQTPMTGFLVTGLNSDCSITAFSSGKHAWLEKLAELGSSRSQPLNFIHLAILIDHKFCHKLATEITLQLILC